MRRVILQREYLKDEYYLCFVIVGGPQKNSKLADINEHVLIRANEVQAIHFHNAVHHKCNEWLCLWISKLSVSYKRQINSLKTSIDKWEG
jgi:hypothetical protein